MDQFSMGCTLQYCSYKLKTTNKMESIHPMQMELEHGHAGLHHGHARLLTSLHIHSNPIHAHGWTQFALRMRLADCRMKLTGRTMTSALGKPVPLSWCPSTPSSHEERRVCMKAHCQPCWCGIPLALVNLYQLNCPSQSTETESPSMLIKVKH
jgi:hypothetical protein